MPVRISCPSCNKALRVPDDSLGRKVRCPACSTAFTAEAPPEEETEGIQTAPTSGAAAPEPGSDEEENEGVQQGPVPRRKRPPAAEEEEEDEDAPRRGRRPRDSEFRAKRPHRGPVMLTLGIVSLVLPLLGGALFACCRAPGLICLGLAGIAVGVLAWILTARDLAAMRRGEMDFAGEGKTKFGVALAMGGTAVSALCVVCGGVLLVVALGLLTAAHGH
jgi:predicted Zn finger-like uncharacterized protein